MVLLASLAYGYIAPTFASVFTKLLLFWSVCVCVCVCVLIRTFVIVFKSHLDNLGHSPHLEILNYIYKKLFFQRKNSQVLELRLWTYLFLGSPLGPLQHLKINLLVRVPEKALQIAWGLSHTHMENPFSLLQQLRVPVWIAKATGLHGTRSQ